MNGKPFYELPKLSVKISPLHLFGEHPFNRAPSLNIGLEQRLKKNTNNSLYHEIGIVSTSLGVSAEKIAQELLNEEDFFYYEYDIVSVKGFRFREQFRSYFVKGKRAFIFIGAEVYYEYQNATVGAWNSVANFQEYYEFNRIRKIAGINPVFGFSYFSKNTEYKNNLNKFMNHIVMDLYVGFGVRMVSRELRNVPSNVDQWGGNGFLSFGAFEDNAEGNFYSPGVTLGFKIGYVISK